MFRRLAGRPTQADLNAKRLELLNLELNIQKAKIDSLELHKAELEDSILILESVINDTKVKNTSNLGILHNTELKSSYYVVIGIFVEKENALKLIEKVTEQGYFPTLIELKSGKQAVGVAGAATFADALLSLKSIAKEDFCPEDAWILINK